MTMRIPLKPPVGHLIAYEYVWASVFKARDEGEKTYPVAVVAARHDLGPVSFAYVLAISHSPPRPGDRALQVPLKLKRHLGLDDGPSWIYTDQVNVFAWPGPDLRPAERLSRLPRAIGTCVIGALPTDWFKSVTVHMDESRRLGHFKLKRRDV